MSGNGNGKSYSSFTLLDPIRRPRMMEREALGAAQMGQMLKGFVRGQVTFMEPLSRHTSFGIGGPADVVVYPSDEEDLERVLVWAEEHSTPVLTLGGGTNVLVDDAGFRGIIAFLQRGLSRVSFDGENVRAEAGVGFSALVGAMAGKGLSGLEFAWGIPGTVGGAIKGNAGAFGRQISDVLTEVEGIDRCSGERVRLNPSELGFGYRRSGIPDLLILTAARFRLLRDDPTTIRSRMLDFLRRRRSSQPVQERTAGCIFKNPPSGPAAGALIERVGCKGLYVGDAGISERHANFIVNRRDARASDVRELIEQVRTRIREATGVELELEIRLIGRNETTS